MNKLTMNAFGEYIVECENGETIKATRWFEKKTGAWHVKLPADNPTGRTYIRESLIKDGHYEFETKTSGPRGFGSAGKLEVSPHRRRTERTQRSRRNHRETQTNRTFKKT